MKLTQKEATLIKDLKTQEMLCAEKYQKHSESAVDKQLSKLFNELSAVEQNHYKMLCTLEKGRVPKVGGQQQGGSKQKSQQTTKQKTTKTFKSTYGTQETKDKQNDSFLCNDVLAAEKQASGLYNTCVFEFVDPQARKLLNQIQTQEQNHGKYIYDYMSANGMQG